jgi:hypothetical protein
MVARPTEVSTDIHPYEVLPTRPLDIPAKAAHGRLASALLAAAHRVGASRDGMRDAELRTARREPVEAQGERIWHHAA